MADNFQYGEQVSQAKMTTLLTGLRDQGTTILDTLTSAVDVIVSGFNRRLQAMNGRVQRSNRTKTATTLVNFLVSDFLDIDQGTTTATVRPDVQSAHLRERSVPATAVVKSTNFSPDIGSVEQLDKSGTQFRVHTDNNAGQIPTGVFLIELTAPVQLTFLVFDVVPTPSQPVLKVETSPDNISFTAAQNVSSDADRITAWLTPQSVRFVRLTIVPTHPDELSGTTFTFGILDFRGSGTDYQLQSELLSKVLTITPQGNSMRFVAPVTTGVSYYLATGLPGALGPYVAVNPGDVITLPGSGSIGPLSVGMVGVAWSDPNTNTTIASTSIALNSYVRPTVPNGFIYQATTVSGALGSVEPTWPLIVGNTIVSGSVTFTTQVDGILNHSLATNAYLRTLTFVGDDDLKSVTPAIGLSFTDPNIGRLTRRYVSVNGTVLRYVSVDISREVGRTFTLAYQTGPASVVCSLKVRLSSSDRSVTPVFTGASLQQV